jgi:competence protein ComGA
LDNKPTIEEKSRELLELAYRADASDIHFLPRFQDTLIEIRVHGYLRRLTVLPIEEAERMINHFKFVAGMDIGRRRLPQSGAMRTVVDHEHISLRLSTLPAAERESLVIRLLPLTRDLSIANLSVFAETVNRLNDLLNYENGLILIAGPTGSGKTTTLYALLAAFYKRYHSRIITLEDPIEIRREIFIQMEVNERANFTYAEGFRAILRHDPDIVMIGEIRDEETARMAIRASLTGHLVLSTVHAYNAVGTVRRMTELGVSRFDLRETLVGVIAERLTTIVCPECGSVCAPDCTNRHHPRRTGIFEILAGRPLHDLLSAQTQRPIYKTIEDYVREGIRTGWIPRESLRGGGADVLAEKMAEVRTGRISDTSR